MIAYLKGAVLSKTPDSIILLAGQVGYKVFLSQAMLAKTPGGQEIEVFCRMHIKKDETLELYGVPTLQNLQLFDTVLAVSGIGPKAALAISSLGTVEEFRQAVQKRDETFFAGLHGVGKKKIQKIILELTGKLEDIGARDKGMEDEALSALVRLGFSQSEARNALEDVSPKVAPVQQRIREALKLLGKR